MGGLATDSVTDRRVNSSAGHLPTIRLGRRLLVPTHKLYALLGIPTTDLIQNGDHPDSTDDETPGDGTGDETGGRP